MKKMANSLVGGSKVLVVRPADVKGGMGACISAAAALSSPVKGVSGLGGGT